MPSVKQTAQMKATEERRQKALNLRAAGASVTGIAKQLNVDKSTISRDISEALKDIKKEAADTLRDLQRKTLLDLRVGLWPNAKRGDVPSVLAIRALLDHEAKLLGLYAPTTQQHVVATGSADFAETTARLLAAINGSNDQDQGDTETDEDDQQ